LLVTTGGGETVVIAWTAALWQSATIRASPAQCQVFHIVGWASHQTESKFWFHRYEKYFPAERSRLRSFLIQPCVIEPG
jgi:hypothetical protein